MFLPEDVVKRLGLPKIGQTTVRYTDGRTAQRDLVEYAQVELFGRHGIFRAIVEPNRTTAVIGVIVLQALDLLVDARNNSLMPRDPHQTIFECEWALPDYRPPRGTSCAS
jgi:hypothetical protein